MNVLSYSIYERQWGRSPNITVYKFPVLCDKYVIDEAKSGTRWIPRVERETQIAWFIKVKQTGIKLI